MSTPPVAVPDAGRDSRSPDPRLPAAYASRPPAGQPPASVDRSADPLRFCVFTTVALLAWLLHPAVVVAAMSVLGLRAYRRAIRGGLTESRCVLRRPKLVLAYLAAALAASLAYLAYVIAGLVPA